ncbi:MAG: type 3 domain protein [Myxococcaceae bacterium]|nr:type 3 domain protein [Myxococcaceae bacterium]
MRLSRWPWRLALALVPALARAQDGAGGDDQGFAEVPASPGPANVERADEPSGWRLSGSLQLQSALRLERSGADRLAKLRQVIVPRLEYARDLGQASFQLVASGRGEADFAYLLRPEAYDAPTMQLYGSHLIVGESYLRLATETLQASFGEQIVNFGQGEVLTLLDVVNPRDLREPLFADLDQLRLPVLMTRLSLGDAHVRGDLLLVHEPFFGLQAPPLGELSPLRKLLLDDPLLGQALSGRALRYRHLPGRDPTNIQAMQVHARVAWSGSGVDLALQASSLLDPLGVPSLPSALQLTSQRIDLPTYHPRYTLLGQSGAVSLGPCLLRWELAGELARPLLVRRTDTRLPIGSSERFNTVRGLFGVTYVPNGRSSVALEGSQTGVLEHPGRRASSTSALLFPVQATQLALRGSHTFDHERAQLSLVLLLIGLKPFNALAARAELSYALMDAVRAAVGVVSYLPSEHFGPFYGFERNDRAYLNLRWDIAAN